MMTVFTKENDSIAQNELDGADSEIEFKDTIEEQK
jgi:hypothetical protein